ncbi:MAG: extracellular solute-binding protein [Nostoc sp.]|uniref:extracellular solute-binding protein n=1 Tax=Nostoc sp. TaxID=1180 RepID=UPI002FF79D39
MTSDSFNTSERVNVAYAGSLVNLIENKLAPNFERATGYKYQGKAAGSTVLANAIRDKIIQPDVFISASTKAYERLSGAANGKEVKWSLVFASTSMVIGYSPVSQFIDRFNPEVAGTVPWYQVLQQPGVRLGRTDPTLDPKGVYTILVMQLASLYYNQSDIKQTILGLDINQTQIFPEADLVAYLKDGNLDAGFFYLNEVLDVDLPYISLPAEINLGDPNHSDFYQQAHYQDAQGQTIAGEPILYSLTIPTKVENYVGAVEFVKYLLGSNGRQLLLEDGLSMIPLQVDGDLSSVPQELLNFLRM